MSAKDILKQWKLHIIILLTCMLSDKIGNIVIQITPVLKITLMPLLYAMIIITALYLIKPFKLLSHDQDKAGVFMMGQAVILLVAKLGTSVGSQFNALLEAGIPLLLQNIGGGFCFILGVPVALALGLKRETIGLCTANSREGVMALIGSKYGEDGPEFRGVVAMYCVGTCFGAIVMGLVSSIFGSLGIFHPYSLAMAVGCGSASMSTAGIGSLSTLFPDMAEQISAFATASNLLSSSISTYLALIVGIPLTEVWYKLFYPIIGKKARAKAEAKEAARVAQAEGGN